jgi:23S rRNA (guanosine2251-2'-O)-methyltransferase
MSQNSRLIFGFHSTLAKLRHDPGAVREIYVDAARHDARLRDLLAHAEFATVRVLPVDFCAACRRWRPAPGTRE